MRKQTWIILLLQLTWPVMVVARQRVDRHEVRTNPYLKYVSVRSHHADMRIQGDGPFIEHHNEKPLFAATLKKGKLHGRWQSWYQNGQRCDSGSFVNGLPDGTWKHWNEDGQLIAIVNYNADKYQRITTALIRHHSKKVDYPLVKMYAVNRQLALYHLTPGSSFEMTGNSSAMTIRERVLKNIAGQYKPVFNRSLHHGLAIKFHANGLVKDSGFYVNGLKHGFWKHADVDGVTHSGVYHHGVKVKEWKTFEPGGRIVALEVYNHSGKLRKRRSFK